MSDPITNDSVVGAREEDVTAGDVNEPDEKALPEVSVRLAETRIARGVSQQDMAGRLFLGVSVIKNIDEGKFERIGKPAFLKGYLRSYARELDLSGDEVIATYEAELHESDVETSGPRSVTEQRVGSSNFTGPVATTGIYSLIAIVSILVAIWWFSPARETPLVTSTADPQMLASDEDDAPGGYTFDVTMDNESRTETDTSSQFQTASLKEQLEARALLFDDIESASGEEEQAEDSSEAGSGPVSDNGQPLEESIEETTAEDAGVIQSEILIDRSSDLESQVISVTAGGDDHLQFVFTDDCWLEIEDASGNLIYGDLNHDKDVLNLYGVAPFKLLVGKVSAVTVIYNDRSVSFEGNTFNDTAKLIIE